MRRTPTVFRDQMVRFPRRKGFLARPGAARRQRETGLALTTALEAALVRVHESHIQVKVGGTYMPRNISKS